MVCVMQEVRLDDHSGSFCFYLFCINCRGGLRSPSLCAEAMKLWNWCIANHILISASYLLDMKNTIANNVSRYVSQDWVGTGLLDPQKDFPDVRISRSGHLCDNGQQKVQEILSVGVAFLIPWTKGLLCISSDSEDSEQDQTRQSQSHFICTNLTKTSLEPLPDSSCFLSNIAASSHFPSAASVLQLDCPSQPVYTPVQRLVPQ